MAEEIRTEKSGGWWPFRRRPKPAPPPDPPEYEVRVWEDEPGKWGWEARWNYQLPPYFDPPLWHHSTIDMGVVTTRIEATRAANETVAAHRDKRERNARRYATKWQEAQ